MNHPPSGSLFLSKAIPGFINYKTAEGLALRTSFRARSGNSILSTKRCPLEGIG